MGYWGAHSGLEIGNTKYLSRETACILYLDKGRQPAPDLHLSQVRIITGRIVYMAGVPLIGDLGLICTLRPNLLLLAKPVSTPSHLHHGGEMLIRIPLLTHASRFR